MLFWMRSKTYISKINLQRWILTVDNRRSREKKRICSEVMSIGKQSGESVEDRMSLWYWLRRDLKEDQLAAEWVRFQMFSAWRRVDRNARRVAENHGFDGDWRLESLFFVNAECINRFIGGHTRHFVFFADDITVQTTAIDVNRHSAWHCAVLV